MTAYLLDVHFWVLISFLIFVVLAFRKGASIIGGALDKRSQSIGSDLANAQRLRDEAQALLIERRRQHETSLREAEQILQHAREETARLRKEATASIHAAVKRREAQAFERIALAEAAAVAEIRNVVVDVALFAARRVLEEHNERNQGTSDPLVDSVIPSLGPALRLN